MAETAPVKKDWLKNSGEAGEWRPSWGGGKGGWGKGGGNWGNKSRVSDSQAVPDDFEPDVNARYQGVVDDFWKFKGCGWITMEQKGICPEDKVFVFWKDIQSEDRFPCLVKDMRVDFGLKVITDKGKKGVRATNVRLPTGENIALQDEEDAKKKEFVGGQYLRYTGTLQFYSFWKGFGYIKLDEGFALDDDVPKELRVETSEVNAGGKNPDDMRDVQVEFGIWKTQKGGFKAYNMTLPGGLPITREQVEKRVLVQGAMYTGTIVTWVNWGDYGYIQAEASAIFPDDINTKLVAMQKATEEKGKTAEAGGRALYFRRHDVEGFKPEKGAVVSFQIYTDEKGVGACQVTLITPAPAQPEAEAPKAA